MREETTRQRRHGTGKRLWQAGMVLALLVGLIGFAGVKPAAAASSYIDTDVLNLRTDPGVWASVITKMYQGESISVIDGPTDDGWYEVDYAGNVGWAWGGYLAVNGSLGWDGAPPSTGGDSGGDIAVSDGPGNKWIDVNRSSNTVTLFEGDNAVASYNASLGYDTSDQGFYSTASGTYYIFGKNAGLTWTDWGKAYIEYWMAFDGDRSNGFHSWSMDANGNVLPNGDGLTGGCVALEPGAAAAVYDWAPIGTRVEIHW